MRLQPFPDVVSLRSCTLAACPEPIRLLRVEKEVIRRAAADQLTWRICSGTTFGTRSKPFIVCSIHLTIIERSFRSIS